MKTVFSPLVLTTVLLLLLTSPCHPSTVIDTFGQRLLSVLSADSLKDNSNNVVLSPLSISLALTAALVGARGETRAEIQQVLGVQKAARIADRNILEGEQNSLRHLLIKTRESERETELSIANAVVIPEGVPIAVKYSSNLQEYLRSEVLQLDLKGKKSKAAIDQINKWSSDKTLGIIPELLSEESITNKDSNSLLLLNAVAFYAPWRHPFQLSEVAQLYPEPFYCADGQVTRVVMMRNRFEDHDKIDLVESPEHGQILSIPYEDPRFEMYIHLPPPYKGSSELNFQFVSGLNFEKKSGCLIVEMPKFNLKSDELSLRQALKQLGMVNPFIGWTADLSAISPGQKKNGLHLSDLVHRTLVRVDERGADEIEESLDGPSRAWSGDYTGCTHFRVDRPFAFVVRHIVEPRVDLLVGRVNRLP